MNVASCMKTVMVMLLLAGSRVDVQAQQQQQYSNLPLLSGSSPVLGTTRFGSADLPAAGDPLRARLEQAAAAGLSGFTLYLDWPALDNDDAPLLAVSDEDGNIWVYFVTDSGFTGRSSIYITDFRVAVARVTTGTVITQ
mgnify:CR=1 FL=1